MDIMGPDGFYKLGFKNGTRFGLIIGIGLTAVLLLSAFAVFLMKTNAI